VLEPSTDDAYKILKGLKSRFEEHHGLRYTDQALRVATDLSARYITDRFLPDKAIDVIDEAGAYQQLQPPSKRKKVVGKHDVEAVVAKIARIPPKSVNRNDKEVLQKLESNLQDGGVRPGCRGEQPVDLDQDGAGGTARRRQAHRLLPPAGPHGRW
jgi:ATP-dependent Clp protease ATP-binding subunit ClpA